MNIVENAQSPASLLMSEVGQGDHYVSLDYRIVNPTEIHLEQIWSEVERRAGHGTQWMRRLCDAADRHGVELSLIVSPLHYEEDRENAHLNQHAMTQDQLVNWYKGFGFAVLTQDVDGPLMVREPRDRIVETTEEGVQERSFEQHEVLSIAGDLARKIKNPFNFCKQASKTLASHLIECGYEPTVFRCSGLETYAPKAHKRWLSLGKQMYWTHYVVLCEGLVIDLTRQQFFPECPAVFVTTLEELKKEWLEISRVANWEEL